MLDELHKLIWDYEMNVGTRPDRIIITKSVMRDFMCEVNELRGEFEHTFDTEDGIVGKYYGIPVHVVYGDDDDKRIVVTGERDRFEHVYMGLQEQCYRTYNPLTGDNMYTLMTRIGTDSVRQKEDDPEAAITDEQFVDLLNGGGFNVVP